MSQKLSQLSTSSKIPLKFKSTDVEMATIEHCPEYLSKTSESFEAFLDSIVLKNTITTSKREHVRQVAIYIQQIQYNEILHSLWTVHLRSGLGKLETQYYSNQPQLNLWPRSVKRMVKMHIRSDVEEENACHDFVKKRLGVLEREIQQAQAYLHDQLRHLGESMETLPLSWKNFS